MFAVSFIVLTLLQLSLQQGIEVPGILQTQTKQTAERTLLDSDQQSCDGTRMFSTCNSCNVVSICLGNTMDSRYCSYVTPNKPFCNNGECSATPGSDSGCSWNMYCTGVGFYPDPQSCESYHYCERKDSMSLVYKCPEGYVLNPDTFFCKQQQKKEDCMKVVCNPNEIFSSYGSSKRFFGYCTFYSSPVASSVKVYKCAEGTEFDGKSCVYKCSAEGRFPDSANERTYYECYYSGDALKATAQVCPYGTSFNQTLSTCISIPTTTIVPTTNFLTSTTNSPPIIYTTTYSPTTRLPTATPTTTYSPTATEWIWGTTTASTA
ncbi:uncharacterized protein LOC135711631 [Ochlerotatus camptorhynchus]|uniref:uncharacterized protein LOC135711631 n=1 Tax=Ochlerotatus camptorhynchus TaxID=644619 RepID=UPI0031D572BC